MNHKVSSDAFFLNIAPNVNNLTFSHTINFRWQKSIVILQADEGNKSYSFRYYTLHYVAAEFAVTCIINLKTFFPMYTVEISRFNIDRRLFRLMLTLWIW